MQSEIKRALLYMFLSTLFFAVMNALVKYLQEIPAMELVFFRSVGSAVFATGYLLKQRIPVLGTHRGLLLLRALIGVTAMSLFFTALKYLPLGLAVTLRYLAPIFAVAYAFLLFKERITLLQAGFLAVAFCGVLIIRGFSEDADPYGLLLIFLAAAFSGMVYVIIRKIGLREHPAVVVNYFMVTATCVGGLLAIPAWRNPEGLLQWVMLLSLGGFGYAGQLYMTRAFQLGETQKIAPFKYAEVVLVLLIGVLIFDERYSLASLSGVVLVVAGLALYAYFGKQRPSRA